ncbi:MAG: OsmC family protein [Gemmatimonadales bacterium]
MQRTAQARWEGELRTGSGSVRLGSGAFEGKFTFGTRFESSPGTNPEELLGAAHAGCFTMALANTLAKDGHPATSIDTTATVHLEKVGEGFSITRIDLTTRGVVPGISSEEFTRAAEDMGANCIVSRALKAVPTRVQATLVSA